MPDITFEAMAKQDRDHRSAMGRVGPSDELPPEGLDNVFHIRRDDGADRESPPLSAYEAELELSGARSPIIPSPKRTSRFYSAAELGGRHVPPREWLVDDLVPQKTVTLMSGDGGTGKSLLALQLAIAAVTGTAWLGRPVQAGRVIYFTAEDDEDELHRRIDDILCAGGLSYDQLAGLTLRSLAGEDALLAVETQTALIQSTLFDELETQAESDGPVLIVIDTLANVYPSNENDRAKVRQFVGILLSLALKRRCAVMLLSHPSLSGMLSGSGMSGNTAWSNSVRSRLYLKRVVADGEEHDPDKRVLATKKANYGPPGGEIAMTWRDGVFVAEGTPDGLDRMAVGAKAERVFLELLDKHTAQGRRVNANGGSLYAPKVFAESAESEGITKRAFKAAMDGLFHAETIKMVKTGPVSRPVTYLARAEE